MSYQTESYRMTLQQPHISAVPRQPLKVTRASQLVELLRAAILRGELRPGEKIGLDRLRDRYEVSLSPLREGMARLVSSRLIEAQDQRGYKVAPVSAADLAEIVGLRRVLDAKALGASIARADLEWESAVLGALHRLNRIGAGADSDQTAGLGEALREFHAALTGQCGQPILIDLAAMLFDLDLRYLTLFGATLAGNAEARAERSAIAQAAVSRDAGAAAALLARHLDRIGAELSRRIPSTTPTTPTTP